MGLSRVITRAEGTESKNADSSEFAFAVTEFAFAVSEFAFAMSEFAFAMSEFAFAVSEMLLPWVICFSRGW